MSAHQSKVGLLLVALAFIGACTGGGDDRSSDSKSVPSSRSIKGETAGPIARRALSPTNLLVPQVLPDGLHLEVAAVTTPSAMSEKFRDSFAGNFTVYESPPQKKPVRKIALTSAGQGDSATYPFISYSKDPFRKLKLGTKLEAAIAEYPHGRRILTWPLGKKCCGQAMLMADGLTRRELLSVARRIIPKKESEFDRLQNLPFGMRAVVSGPVAAALLQPMRDPIIGSDVIIRYTNRSSKAALQLILMRADDKLSKAIDFLIAGRTATIRGQRGVDGELASAIIYDHGRFLGKSWTENGILVLAASEGLPAADFDRVINNLRLAELSELSTIGGEVKNYPLNDLFPLREPVRRRLLAAGNVQANVSVVWATWVYEDQAKIGSTVHFSDGRRCPTFDGEIQGSSKQDEGSFIEAGYANLCDPGGAGPAFAFGLVPPNINRVVLYLRSGSTREVKLSDVDPAKAYRTFGEVLPGREPGKVVGIAEVRKYDASGACWRRTLKLEEEPCTP